MNFYTLSDKGKVRTNNEDYAESFKLSWIGPLGNQINLTALILADGMGGAAAGEYASMLAVKTIKEQMLMDLLLKLPEDLLNSDKTNFLEKCFIKSNASIYNEALKNTEKAGMGTTILSGIIYRNVLTLAHVGDSRAYRFRNNTLSHLTKDHSLVQELVDKGDITMEQAFVHPNRNVITRALGVSPTVKVDSKNITLEKNDLIMLCSDGLCGFVEDSAIEKIISDQYDPKGTNLKLTVENLLKVAYLNGGGDNITMCVYQHTEY